MRNVRLTIYYYKQEKITGSCTFNVRRQEPEDTMGRHTNMVTYNMKT